MAQGRTEPAGPVGVLLTARVGTSGWSYDDWVGPVYPEGARRRPGAWLGLYAERFSTVEINSTFYRLPGPRVVAGWIRKARGLPGPFEFSLKAPQDVTHGAMVAGDAAATAAGLIPLREGILRPLREAGLLGAVLLQLAPRFGPDAPGRRALAAALEALAGFPVAAEPRHAAWAAAGEEREAALDVLRAADAALAWVDGPHFPPIRLRTASHGYVRFHGRRADIWSAPDRGPSERYDYRYSEGELRPWVAPLRAEGAGRGVRIYFNNHPGGKAVENAEWMARALEIPPPPRPVRPRQRGLGEFGDPD